MPEFADQKCPRCGSTLLTSDRKIWCSFVGGRNEGPCSFGLDAPVFVGSFPQRPVSDERAAFQSAILDQPDADDVRLVYADHLRESADEFDQLLGRFIWSGVTLSQFRGSEPAQDGMFFDAIKEQATAGPRVLATQLRSLFGWGPDEFAWDNANVAPDRISACLIPDRVEGESVTQRRARRRRPDQAPFVVWERGCVTRVRLTFEKWCDLGRHLLRHCPITGVEILNVPGLTFKILGPEKGWQLSATLRLGAEVVINHLNGESTAIPGGWDLKYPADPFESRAILVDQVGAASRNIVHWLRDQVRERWPGVAP